MEKSQFVISKERVERRIFLIRGQKMMLDRDLAELYGVGTRDLMSHFGTSSWGGVRKLPRAFTEHGILMLSSVLRSKRAIQVNIAIMRAFVRLRRILAAHRELAQKLVELERKVESHDQQIRSIFDAIRQLMAPPSPLRRRIGFHPK